MSCPRCGAAEVASSTPRTTYACGSSDYDQRPGSFAGSCATSPATPSVTPSEEPPFAQMLRSMLRSAPADESDDYTIKLRGLTGVMLGDVRWIVARFESSEPSPNTIRLARIAELLAHGGGGEDPIAYFSAKGTLITRLPRPSEFVELLSLSSGTDSDAIAQALATARAKGEAAGLERAALKLNANADAMREVGRHDDAQMVDDAADAIRSMKETP